MPFQLLFQDKSERPTKFSTDFFFTLISSREASTTKLGLPMERMLLPCLIPRVLHPPLRPFHSTLASISLNQVSIATPFRFTTQRAAPDIGTTKDKQ